MIKKASYVMGTGLSHDGSVCILKNGKIAVAIEKERITRIKHDGGNDALAMQYCLDALGIELNDLDLIVQNANFGKFEFGNDYFAGPRLIQKDSRVPMVTISHHLAHAYNAIGTAPFKEMAIAVIDGCGSSYDDCMDLTGAYIPEKILKHAHLYAEKDSYYHYQSGQCQACYKDFSPFGFALKNYPMHPDSTQHSLGGLYAAASHYIFGSMQDAGKLMGLAPYGRPQQFSASVFTHQGGRVFVNYAALKDFTTPMRSYQDFKDNFQYCADIAYWIQQQLEQAIIYILTERYRYAPQENLAYTGGVALNAVANAKLLERTPFNQIFFTPAAGDNGLAIGCAYYGWLAVLKQDRVQHDGTTAFGRIYHKKEIRRSLQCAAIASQDNPLLIEAFFNCLPHYCCLDKNVSLLFIFKQLGMWLLNIQDGKAMITCRTQHVPSNIDCTLITDSQSFFAALNNQAFSSASIYQAGILVQGAASVLAAIDWEKLIKILPKRLAPSSSTPAIYFTEQMDVLQFAAESIARGNIIGWFSGSSEFGPRALGHRSILADPRRHDIKDFINQKIKFREDFRPFAPSILIDEAKHYFALTQASPYMILVAAANADCKKHCPGIVHQDGSARVQTVDKALSPIYYRLIKAFQALTGIPMLLNTSLNKRGMPIVEQPSEALDLYATTAIDYLIIDNFLIAKQALVNFNGKRVYEPNLGLFSQLIEPI